MVQPFRHITVQLTADAEVPVDAHMSGVCVFIRHALPFNLARVIAPLSAKAKKADSLGHLWSGIGPAEDGYVFHVATELPYYLPDLVGRPEYLLRVGSDEVFVCNRMVRIYYGKGRPEGEGLDYYLIHRLGMTSLAGHASDGPMDRLRRRKSQLATRALTRG